MEGRDQSRPGRASRCALIALLAILAAACSARQFALEGLADGLGGTAGAFAADEDPELVGAALPFALKLMESIQVELPEHEKLLLGLASGFTQYSYAFVQVPAEELEQRDFDAAAAQKRRAVRLYLRAHGYGISALELTHPGLGQALERDPAAALTGATREDVPLLYWSGAALGLAIALSKGEPEMIARVPQVEALMARSLALDEAYGAGVIHEFYVTYLGADDEAVARKHFERAVELSGGRHASTFVALAEAVCVKKQDRPAFEKLLQQALSIDLNAEPENRLANVLAQRKARRLLARIEDLFLD